ncbi:chloramphenicol acetyltransferase [Planctobacterium marinum]|uniref:Chloramphenicol acetyltransferase n=1 Tax=Planctobacterium marinum TaxID=1631968 RepID=A0AA48HTR0_9ALTE|nr:chloramphenicol acetyltransferase [Planctobacterium marinum]
MNWIEMENWPRKRHFDMFQRVDMPHFSITADVEVTQSLAFCKQRNISSSTLMLYLISRTANEIENMLYRIRADKVCIHTSVDPAFTVLADDELYYHCRVRYQKDFLAFCEDVKAQSALAKQDKTLHTEKQDDVIYLSCLPWVAFTGNSHAMHFSPVDSVPRYYWGKYHQRDGKMMMPFSVQVHHGLADGLHVGRQFDAMQRYLSEPESIL